ncbi:MAG: ATP-dependent DNA helicase [Gammaproteobacteria bacterium]|nr:ATP-dependent DNA helicase [Gammaproteobacteria bacterium]
MPTHPASSLTYFSDASPLRESWPGFTVRTEQRALAEAVENALSQRQPMALEAPTGTGKTLAYLLPVLMHSQRIIISVGNRTLQDHLWWGEYQKLRSCLPQVRPLTVLKGCENYICRWKLDEQLQTGERWVAENWQAISIGLQQTRSGEINTLPLPDAERAIATQQLTVTADQCLGQRCTQFGNCYFQQARTRAAQAEVLLINHTLLLSDNRLFEKGMGALLPVADAVVVDEAHQLPDLLVRFNTDMLDGYRLQRWLRQVRSACKEYFGLFPTLKSGLNQLESMWEKISHQLHQSGEDNLVQVAAVSLLPLLKLLMSLDVVLRQVQTAHAGIQSQLEQLQAWRSVLGHAIAEETVLQADTGGRWLRLIAGRVQSPFANLAATSANWIFISATLAVDNSFTWFKRILDLPQLQVQRFAGELDYARQAMLWIPESLPEPTDEAFMSAWIEQVLTVARDLDGGMLLLFSSHEALQNAAQLLQGRTDRQLLIHLPGSHRQQLLQQFRQNDQSLLLGTGSFWEGIDVSGAALRCIAIDKLPFTPPDDILALAWKFMAAKQGQHLFNDYMVPQAITRFRQGIGRLLRSSDDRGLILVGDTRLLRKPYGQRFLSSLPPVPVATSFAAVQAFFREQGLLRPD